MLQRNPALKPEEVRATLMKTARDLGPPGPDDQFGAGEADAFAAVSAVSVPSLPVAAAPQQPATTDVSDTRSIQPGLTENLPAATVAAEKPAGSEPQPDMGKKP
jgi:hypothetical protein